MNIEIQQIIMVKEHTMVEVDSVHSTLGLFKLPIYTPAHYITNMGETRRRTQHWVLMGRHNLMHII
jgi:hypothetical protein